MACSGAGDDAVRSGVAVGGDGTAELPGAFGAVEDHHRILTASDTHLFGVGPSRPAEGNPEEIGHAVDLETFDVVGVPRPGDEPTLVQAAVTDDDGALHLLGVTCDSLIQPENDPDACEEKVRGYRYDVAGARWTDDAVPDGVGGPVFAQAGPGGPVVVFGSTTAGGRFTVVRLVDDRWEPIATTAVGNATNQWCATASDLFVLRVSSDPEVTAELAEGYPSEPVTRYELAMIGLEDGAERLLPVPDLFPFFGGAAVELGCGAGAPVVVSSAGRGAAPTTFALRGERWEQLDPGISGGVPASAGDVASGVGAIVSWSQIPGADGAGGEAGGTTTIVAVDGEGEVHTIAEDVADTVPLWQGQRDTVLLIGPRSTTEGADPGSATPLDTVTMRTVEVPLS